MFASFLDTSLQLNFEKMMIILLKWIFIFIKKCPEGREESVYDWKLSFINPPFLIKPTFCFFISVFLIHCISFKKSALLKKYGKFVRFRLLLCLHFLKGLLIAKMNIYIYIFLAPILLPYEALFRSNWKKNKHFYFCYFCNLQKTTACSLLEWNSVFANCS